MTQHFVMSEEEKSEDQLLQSNKIARLYHANATELEFRSK